MSQTFENNKFVTLMQQILISRIAYDILQSERRCVENAAA